VSLTWCHCLGAYVSDYFIMYAFLKQCHAINEIDRCEYVGAFSLESFLK